MIETSVSILTEGHTKRNFLKRIDDLMVPRENKKLFRDPYSHFDTRSDRVFLCGT